MKPTVNDIKAELWGRGAISFKLHAGQKELYDLYRTGKEKTNVWLLGRRSGKSYCLATLAIEECLRAPNTIVKVVAPTKTQMEQIVRPIFRDVLKDCPPAIEPRYSSKQNIYYFPHNGSEIQLAGSDGGHAERLRGGACKVAFVDEAQSCQDLGNLVRDILLPTTLTTKGKIILIGTPPKDLDHDFVKFIEEAEIKDTIVRKPTYCNPLVSPEELKLLVDELGGELSDVVRREIYCELIKDPSKSVIPEFDEKLATHVVKEWQRPSFFETYESMDLGFRDFTGVLFGYYDFKHATVVIEDELLLNFQQSDVNIPFLVKKIHEKEHGLWYSEVTGEVKPLHLRISDINPLVTQEIARASGNEFSFANVEKYENIKEALVNQLRVMVSSKKIIIHPRCKNLIAQLKHAKWANSHVKKTFARSPSNGHYDLIDALLYLIKSIGYHRNPYPEHYGMNPVDLFVPEKAKFGQFPTKVNPGAQNVFKSIFKNRGRNGFK